MSAPSLPRFKVTLDLTPDVIEAYLLKGEVLGKPWEQDRRRQQHLLADTPDVMSIVLKDLLTDDLVAICSAVFVSRGFYEDCATASDPWIMARAYDWTRQGKRPFLTAGEVRRGNSGVGLYLMIANYTMFAVSPADRNSIYNELLFTFLERFRGYRLACFFAEPSTEIYVEGLLDHGFVVANAYPELRRSQGRAPLLMATNRERALICHNHFVCRLFDYQVPVAKLTTACQELLREAILGGTDSELADTLMCSAEAIKNRWTKVYESLDTNLPGYLPGPSHGTRGKEKRRMAIAFARQNPWELRPYDWRGLRTLDAIEAPHLKS